MGSHLLATTRIAAVSLSVRHLPSLSLGEALRSGTWPRPPPERAVVPVSQRDLEAALVGSVQPPSAQRLHWPPPHHLAGGLGLRERRNRPLARRCWGASCVAPGSLTVSGQQARDTGRDAARSPVPRASRPRRCGSRAQALSCSHDDCRVFPLGHWQVSFLHPHHQLPPVDTSRCPPVGDTDSWLRPGRPIWHY